MKEIILAIKLFCSSEIDPRYMVEQCEKDLFEYHVINETEMIYCMDYWID